MKRIIKLIFIFIIFFTVNLSYEIITSEVDTGQDNFNYMVDIYRLDKSQPQKYYNEKTEFTSHDGYEINFKLKTCILQRDNTFSKIVGGDLERKQNVLYPSYRMNFYRIMINNYTENDVRKFIKENCNLGFEPNYIDFSTNLSYKNAN